MEQQHNYALVTGASKGIGYELARQLAMHGYNLIIVSRHPQELDMVIADFKQYNVDIIPIAKDLFDPQQAEALYSEIRARGINPEILVNNAGQGYYGKFQETDLHREIAIINLNIISLLTLTKLFIKERLGTGSGRILNLASVASKAPGPWHSVYHGTKAFVLSFSEAIREELRETGITVTALLPGPTDTDFFTKAGMQRSKIVQDRDDLADPAIVAKDGYEALMEDTDKIISGGKNKLQVAMTNIMTDEMAAHRMAEMQKPV